MTVSKEPKRSAKLLKEANSELQKLVDLGHPFDEIRYIIRTLDPYYRSSALTDSEINNILIKIVRTPGSHPHKCPECHETTVCYGNK